MHRRRVLSQSRSRSKSVGKAESDNKNCSTATAILRKALLTYETKHPTLFREMVAARSLSTDRLVQRCLWSFFEGSYTKAKVLHWLENAALQCAHELWDSVYRDAMNASFRQFHFQCAQNLSMNLQRKIFAVKQNYLSHQNVAAYQWLNGEWVVTCEVLHCFTPASFCMNSVMFCFTHSGLALLNGMRHECLSCRVFNLLGFKFSASDVGHQRSNMHDMFLPLYDNAGKRLNVNGRRFCATRVRFQPTDDNWQFMSPHSTAQRPVYRTTENETFPIPFGAWYWVQDSTVVAWIVLVIQIEDDDGVHWALVDEWDVVQDILRRVGSSHMSFWSQLNRTHYPCPVE